MRFRLLNDVAVVILLADSLGANLTPCNLLEIDNCMQTQMNAHPVQDNLYTQ